MRGSVEICGGIVREREGEVKRKEEEEVRGGGFQRVWELLRSVGVW